MIVRERSTVFAGLDPKGHVVIREVGRVAQGRNNALIPARRIVFHSETGSRAPIPPLAPGHGLFKLLPSITPGDYRVSVVVARGDRPPKTYKAWVRVFRSGHVPGFRNQPSLVSGLAFQFGSDDDLSGYSDVRYYCVVSGFNPAAKSTLPPDMAKNVVTGCMQPYLHAPGRSGINPYGTFTFDSVTAVLTTQMRIAVYLQPNGDKKYYYDGRTEPPSNGLIAGESNPSQVTAGTNPVPMAYP